MTAEPNRKPARSEGRSDGPIKSLMKEMGGSGQFTGIPPDQHDWQQKAAPHNPPLHRMWSCMIFHTCAWGHDSPFAVSVRKDGAELHMEHLAKLLGMDLPNTYRTWKEGVRLGLWRNGTPQEGKRKLYLCGKVEPKKGEDKANEIVCTDNFPPLPPYLEKIVNAWEAPRREQFAGGWRRQVALRNALAANQMAAARYIADQSDHNFFKTWGLEKKFLAREEFAVDEELVEAAKRHFEAISPTVIRDVMLDEATDAAWAAMSDAERAAAVTAAQQELTSEFRTGGLRARGWDATRWEQESEAYARRLLRQRLSNDASLSVQTNSESVQRAESTPYGAPEEPGTAALPYKKQLTSREDQRVGVNLDTSSGPRGQKRSNEAERLSTYTGAESRELREETLGAAAALIIGIARLQLGYRDKFAGETVTTQSKADKAWAVKIVSTIGAQEVDTFVLYVELRAKDRAMGHQLTAALIFELAGDFTRRRGQIAQELRDQAAAEEAEAREKEARIAALQAEDERQTRLDEWLRDAWERLDLDDVAGRLAAAEQTMRRDKLWDRMWRHNSDARQVERERRAKAEMRRELDERDRKGGGL